MSDFLALVGIIVAIVLGLGAIAVALYIYRKQNPRREFSYDVRASPLVSTPMRGLDKLTVAYNGSALTSPHLVHVQIASTGRADISSSRFDGGKPVSFELNVPILGEIEQVASTDTVSARLKFTEGTSRVELPPSLLPKGFTLEASYLCDGTPKVEPKVELTDIPVRTDVRTLRAVNWKGDVAVAVGSAVAGAATIVVTSLVR